MVDLNEAFISLLDAKLIERGIPLHARPFQVAISYMREAGINGDLLSPVVWTPLMEIYHRLYPAGDFAIPSMLVGGVGFRDQFYPVRVAIGNGRFSVDPLKCIDISRQELDTIWRMAPDQIWRAMYSVADLWDFAYGTDDLKNDIAEVTGLLQNARGAIAATAQTLAHADDTDSVIQSTCLAAELSMKGALAKLGMTEPDRRKLGRSGHGLPEIATALVGLSSRPSDDRLIKVAGDFPDYAATRYTAHGLKRIALIELAMKAQYIAAEATRRISERNFAGVIERDQRNPSRVFP